MQEKTDSSRRETNPTNYTDIGVAGSGTDLDDLASFREPLKPLEDLPTRRIGIAAWKEPACLSPSRLKSVPQLKRPRPPYDALQ